MVAMCAGTWLVGDSLAFWPAVAVVTITVGVFGVSLSTRQARMESRHLEGILLAAATGGMIAGYHIVDRQAMKLTPSPNRLEYLYLLHLFMAVVVTFWMCISKKRRRSMLTAWTSDWRGVLIVSLLLPTSYFMILLALSYSNVTYVTAGRNVGILISTAVGAMLLREKATGPRLIGILLIACGVVALVWLRGH
jgi:drug/metabolite transporter (DMT)-like permease